MKRITIALIALVSSVLMSASMASAAKPADHATGGKSATAKACVAQKKADKAAFKATYGKHAMRNCIKGEAEAGDDPTADDESEPGDDSGEAKNAAKACKAARAADGDAFRDQYGTNRNGKNAFGKCVSAKSKDSADDEDEDDDEDEADDEDTDTDDDPGDVDDDDAEEVPAS